MEKSQIFIFALLISVVAFKLYQKYGKKNMSSDSENKTKNSVGGIAGSSVKDDYEPYSKK